RHALRVLAIEDTQVTGEALDVLNKCPGLEELRFDGKAEMEVACRAVSACKSLRRLRLASSAVTDEDLQLLGVLPSLYELNVSHTRVCLDAQRLRQFPALTDLYCETERFGEPALSGIPFLKILKLLWVSGRSVNDAGLR